MIHDYSNDRKYVTFEFEESFSGTLSCRVPKRIIGKSHLVDEFIDRHDGDDGFWV